LMPTLILKRRWPLKSSASTENSKPK
jgi:hypothetical protein